MTIPINPEPLTNKSRPHVKNKKKSIAIQHTISKKFQGILENFPTQFSKLNIRKIPVMKNPVDDTNWIQTEEAGVKIHVLKGPNLAMDSITLATMYIVRAPL